MKLMIIIINTEDEANTVKELIDKKFLVTKLSSTGGFLLSGNTTLLVGTEDDKVKNVIEIIKEQCQTRCKSTTSVNSNEFPMFKSYPINIQVGGATIFVLSVDEYKKL